jgi:hypothetical protein
MITAEDTGTRLISPHVHHQQRGRISENRIHLGRQNRHIGVQELRRGRKYLNPFFRKKFLLISASEIGVDNIEVYHLHGGI